MLEVSGLCVHYDQVIAVNGLDIVVEEGEIVTLIGPNGAGKSSAMMAISGVERVSEGRMTFAGEPIDGLESHEIFARGIVQVPEGRLILGELTVRENLLLGSDNRTDRTEVAADLASMTDLFPALGKRLDQKANILSGGQMQMLALARGLMGRPKLLLLDEPSLGLAPIVVEALFATIQTLNEKGLSILLVEQNVALALKVAHRGYLMEAGRIVDTGPAKDLLESPRVIEAYLGGGMPSSPTRTDEHPAVT